MNRPAKHNYTVPTIHVVAFKVEQGFAAYPPNQEEEEITWTDNQNTTENNHFGLESFSNTQTW